MLREAPFSNMLGVFGQKSNFWVVNTCHFTIFLSLVKKHIQGVSKKTLFNEIGTPGGPKTIDRVGDQSRMLSNTLYWSDIPIYPF